MSFRSLLPSLWTSNGSVGADPITNLRHEVDRVFESFGKSLPSMALPAVGWPLEAVSPKVNVVQKDKVVEVTAELPGVDLKDVELLVNDNVLTIKGEKKLEKEDKNAERHIYECSYGAFARSIQIPFGVESKNVTADFKNGVLTVTIPVPPNAQTKAQKVEIRAAA